MSPSKTGQSSSRGKLLYISTGLWLSPATRAGIHFLGDDVVAREGNRETWPELPYAVWRDTCSTLQLWTQIVGKIRLSQTPWLNHSWHVPLYLTARGLTTSPIPHGGRIFEMQFDFLDHVLHID